MSKSQDRFSFSRIVTFGGIAFLLLALFLSSSAQADLIYAVRVNALNAAGNYNYRENNDTYSNYNFSTNDDTNTVRWCTQANNKPYTLTNDTLPVMLCDLGTVRTINAISVSPYSSTSNIVKAMTVEFYDSPAINATPVYTQTFTGIPQSYKNLPLTTPTNARFVKITMTENYGGDRFGVGNLMFDVVSEGTPTSGTVNVPTYQNWPVSNLFDGNITTQWVTNVADATNGYYNGTNPNPVFTFTYDGPRTLTGIGVNGYNVSGNSLKDFNLSFYDANGTQISVADPSQYRFTMTHTTNQTRDEFTFPTVENVSKVEMTLTSNYKGTGSGGDRVGLSEVSFAVPTNLDTPTTPVIYNAPMSSDSTIVRPTSAQFLTPASERASARALTYLFDGTGSAGGAEWYSIDTKVGSNVIPDYYTVGYTPVIEFTMSEQAAYDSFSVWGYGNKGNLMSDFTLELYDSAGNLVYADEYLIDEYINKSSYATFSFGDTYAFKTAVLTALDNGYDYYPGFTGGDRVGFTEIAFYQVPQEPYYYANTSDISASNWTIDGSIKQGVIFTEGDSTATFANPVIFNSDGSIEIGSGKNLTLSGVVSGSGAITKTGAGTLTMTKVNTYSGGTTISEGTVKLTEAGTLGSGSVTVNENATLEFAHASNQTISNDIYGLGSVAKTGTGTLTLSGNNSYYGETTVSAGTLLVPAGASFSSSQVTVSTGGTFQAGVDMTYTNVVMDGGKFVVGATSASKEMTIKNLTLNGGTVCFDFGDSSDMYDADWLHVFSAIFDSGYIDLSFNSSSAEDWWNAINDSGEGFSLINGSIQNYESFDNNSVKVTVNGTLSNRWTLTATNENLLLWAVDGSDDPGPGPQPVSNWYDASDPTDFGLPSWTIDGTTKEGAKLVSGSNVTYSNPVEMTANGGKIQVAENLTLTLSGGLSGSAPLEKTDAGKLTITTANSGFTGDTTVSGGTLELTDAGTLGSSTINVGAGATMLYNNTVPHNESALTFNINGGTLEFYNDTTTTAGHNADIAICSGLENQGVTINGTGGTLLIDGGGCVAALNNKLSNVTFALDANSVIDVRSGYFVNGGYATQNWDNNQATLHIGANGKVELWDGNQMKVGGLTGEVGAQILESKSGNGISIGNGTTADQTFVYNGSIALNGKTLTKVGEGTQVLNSNIANATIQANGGVLTINGDISGATLTSNSGTLVFGVPGETMHFMPTTTISTKGGNIRVDGDVVLNDSSAYVSVAGAWTGDGSITIDTGGYMRIGGTFNFTNGITMNGGQILNSDNDAVIQADLIITKRSNIQAGWSKTLTVTGALRGSENLSIGSDSGITKLTGDGSQYTGSIIVRGNVRIGAENVGTAAEPADGTAFVGPNDIILNGASATIGILQNNNNYITFPNNLNVTAETGFKAGWSKNMTFTGNITGSAKIKAKSDSGWVIMGTQSPDDSFTGIVQADWDSTSSMGQMRLAAEQPFGANAGAGYFYGKLDMNGFSQVFKGLYSNTSGNTKKGQIFNNTDKQSTLTLSITGSDLTYNGALQGNLQLIVNSDGAGKQTLSNGGGTFTGDAFLNGGTVVINAAGSNSNSALGKVQASRTIHVNQGAELQLAVQDTFTNAHAQNPLPLEVDGGKISNSGAFYNYLTNLTLKNGAELHASDGNETWKAYKLHNLKVERNSDGSAGSPVSITADSSKPNATIGFGDISDVIKAGSSVSTINVEEITSANAATSDGVSDLVISAVITDPTYQTNGGLKNATKIIKTGAGTMELTAANTYTGPTTISQGALALASTGSIVSDVTVESGASFIDAARQITSNVTLNGGSLVIGETTDSTQIAFGNLTVDNGSIFFDFNDSAVSTDYDRLTVNAATFTTGTINIVYNNGDQTEWWNNNTDNGYVLVDTTSLNVNLDNIQLLVNSAATDAWYLDTVGTSIVLKNQNVEPPVIDQYYRANSAEDIAAEEWAIDGVNKKGVTFTEGENNTATYNGEVEMNAAGIVDVSENRNLALTGVVSGEGDVTKQGEGTLTLSGDNTYTGATKVSEGTLALTAEDAISNSSSVENNGAITMGADQSLNNLSGNGTIDNGGNALTLNNAAATEFSGSISGAGEVKKTGAETLTLSGDNTYTGKTTVSAGTLELTAENAISNSSSVSVEDNGKIAMGANQTFNNLSGTGTIDNGGNAMTLNNTATTSFSGVVSGNGNVTKTGKGTLQILSTDGQFAPDNFAVEAGRLDFKGQYNGDLIVQTGSTLSPGNSVGDLTVYGNVIIETGATGLFEFSAYDPNDLQYDTLTVNDGAFVIDENSIIKLFFEGNDISAWATEGAEYKLVSDEDFTIDGMPKLENSLGMFDLISKGDGLYLVGLGAGPIPEPGSGVPEPSTWALLILGASGLLFWRRKKN